MNNALFLYISVICIWNCNAIDTITNTILDNPNKYMEDVLQTFLYDLEETGLSKIRMKDFVYKINETLYGFEVLGDLHYHHGFVVGFKSAYIKTSSTNEFLSDQKLIASVFTKLMLDGITFVYDVEAELKSGKVKTSGTYEIKLTEWDIRITKNLSNDVISVDVDMISLQPDSKYRMRFLPKNDITVVFARTFNTLIPDVSNGVREWSIYMKKLIEIVAREKVKFPEIILDRWA